MTRIHILPDNLVSQIAAGEVVERPASVVKELLENALDAGATELALELEAGGKRRIAVRDDGSGLGPDDALLAFDRHATSKIERFEDLERVGTLGFRGEALAAISAVARVEMRTAMSPGEGTRVAIEGGRVRTVEPVAHPRGTTLEVLSLFFNVPARRKFLKTPQTELRRCLEVVQGYALSRPDVRFEVIHKGRKLLEALPTEEGLEGARRRIEQVFGRDLAASLEPFEERSRAPRETISGLVGRPETSRGRRLFVFVNGRLLRDRAILATFYRSVREEWRSDDFPALFLFLDLPAEDVDVNVHPQKAEVRFRDRGIFDRLEVVLRSALERARGEVPAAPRPLEGRPTAPLAWQGWGAREDRSAWSYHSDSAEVREGASEISADRPPDRFAQPSYAPPERSAIPLSGRDGRERPFRLLGQYKGTLILLEGPDGLYLIDQHVAHERLLYERLRRALARDDTPSQALLHPLVLELAPAERARLEELAAPLEDCGYAVSVLSGKTVAVHAVPAVLGLEDAERALLALAGDEDVGGDAVRGMHQSLLEALAASMSCRSAVKMHHPLSAPEMESLVEELFRAEQPYACPHGRPIVLRIDDADLERRFGRR